MLTQIYSSRPTAQKRHHDAPLFLERNRFLTMKCEQGLRLSCLKQWANYLMLFVSDFQLYDGIRTCISLDDILGKAEAWSLPKPRSYHKRKNQKSLQAKEYYIIRAIDFLDYLRLLDMRYYDKTVNMLVESKHAKISLITAPFYKERMAFIEECYLSGYKPQVLNKYAQYQLHLIDFINLKAYRIVTDEEIQIAANKWKSHSNSGIHKKAGTKWNDTFFISVAKKWLTSVNMYKVDITKSISDVRIEQYLQYLEYKGYSPVTLTSSSRSLHDFYDKIGKQNIEDPITLVDVDKSLEMYSSCHTNRYTLEAYMNRIRTYLRYAAEQGWCQQGLADAIILPRIYKEEKLPSYMSWDTVLKILDQMKTTKGKSATRNYTILLLLVTYGLRCSEVANLKISDIDWRKEQIHIQRAKCGKIQTLPLLHSVGEEIITYLRNGRPNGSKSDYLFFCAKAPFRPITCQAILNIVRRAIPSEVNIKHKGPHSFRHSYATFLINNDQTMKEVGDLLGHKSIESTKIYAKVDFQALREVSNINFENVL